MLVDYWDKNTQLFHKWSHSYMFRHYRVIFRELAVSALPSYTSMSDAVVGNIILKFKISHFFFLLLLNLIA